MAANPQAEAALSKLFSQLQIAGEDGDYEWGLEVSEKILKIAPDDQDTLMCRIVCLIQNGDYSDALKAIGRFSKSLGKQVCLYEKAYCQYKLEMYRQSLDTLSSLPPEEQSSIAVLDLTAQVYYRLESYEKSAQTFQQGRRVQDSQERSANMVAALSFCKPPTITAMMAESPAVQEDSMELCFNLATAYLNAYTDNAHVSQAVALLQKSETLCEEAIANNPDDEDNDQELIPIHIQLAYALQCQDQQEKALGMYSSVLKQKPSLVHSMTAANNVIVLNRDKDIFDSKKKIKLISNEQGIKKLNSRQKAVVQFNRCLFALQINQLEQCRLLLQEFKKAFPNSEGVVLIESALLNRERKLAESCEIVERYIEITPSCSILMHLTLAQFYSSQGNHSKVQQVFEHVPQLPQYLGIVSVLMSYYSSTGVNESINQLLSSVISYWKEMSDVPFSDKAKVFWMMGQYSLQHGSPEDAARIFEYLHDQDKSSVKFLANLVWATSRFNTQRAEELGRQLSQTYTSSSVDVDALEQMPSFRHSYRQLAKNEVVSKKPDTGKGGAVSTEVKEKKKKKRKPRLPKHFDPFKPPDPERWLPLRERSYYRKSKKKGQQTGVGRGTQGLSAASANLAAKLDASNKPTKGDGDSKDSSTASSPKPKTTAPQHHKKKKKGRR